MTNTTRRRRAKRPVPPRVFWLLAPFLVCLPLIGALVVPLSPEEAALWQRAVGLRPSPAPLADMLAALSLRILGDTLLALRIPGAAALVLLLLVLWNAERRWRLAVLASAPLLAWMALAEPARLAALVPLALMARLVDAAIVEKITKKAPMRGAPWILAGAVGGIAVLLDPWGLIGLGAIVAALAAGPRPRGALLAAVGSVPVLVPLMLWWVATELPRAEALPPRTFALALAGLGPLVLRRLWPVGAEWRVLAALLTFLVAIALAALGRGSVLLPMLTLVLLVPPVATRIETVRAAWMAAAAPAFACGLVGISGLYALYGAGLPAAGDPFAADRMRPAFCSEILLTLEEEGARALASRHPDALRPCLWQAGLADLPVLEPTIGAVAGVQGAVLMIAFWPDDGAATARRLGDAARIGERSVPGHLDVEQRFTMWRVEPLP